MQCCGPLDITKVLSFDHVGAYFKSEDEVYKKEIQDAVQKMECVAKIAFQYKIYGGTPKGSETVKQAFYSLIHDHKECFEKLDPNTEVIKKIRTACIDLCYLYFHSFRLEEDGFGVLYDEGLEFVKTLPVGISENMKNYFEQLEFERVNPIPISPNDSQWDWPDDQQNKN
jgi:hypothetical protein